MIAQTVVATPRYQSLRVTKKQDTYKDKMNSSNNNKYVIYTYLKFIERNADRMQSLNMLALAIDNF